MSQDLIDTARKLARTGQGRPKQADLKRAISTAYYALFHAMARDAANCLVGTGTARPKRAWNQVFRAIGHGFAKTACSQARSMRFPAGLIDCAEAFVQLQDDRNAADYDPDHRVSKALAMSKVELAETSIKKLSQSPKRDRTAFAVHVLLKRRM